MPRLPGTQCLALISRAKKKHLERELRNRSVLGRKISTSRPGLQRLVKLSAGAAPPAASSLGMKPDGFPAPGLTNHSNFNGQLNRAGHPPVAIQPTANFATAIGAAEERRLQHCVKGCSLGKISRNDSDLDHDGLLDDDEVVFG